MSVEAAEKPAAWYSWRNMNWGEIAPDIGTETREAEAGVETGDWPELIVTALGLALG